MVNPKELDRSVERSLDDVGRFFRRWWPTMVLVAIIAWFVLTKLPPSAQTAGLTIAFQLAFAFVFIIIQFVGLFWFMGRPRMYWVMPGESGVGFDDYKGNPEVLEAARRIVTLLRGVRNFKQMGGEVSRGVLLVGPPGTGKSYLAQCISTEAGVPFAYASTSSFRAMFMGMDVLMIKGLYRKARRLAREFGGCIIFLDEFDAIGMSRGSNAGSTMGMGGGMGFFGGGGGTGGLNELLMQMDPPPGDNSIWKRILRQMGLFHGKNQREPVLTIGATNIPDSLDAALLRPGRFDRRIAVVPPSDSNRGEVVDYYLQKVVHEPIDLNKLVGDFRGYTPVAIKYVINEAVVIAHFDGRSSITYKDIAEARETHEHGLRLPRQLSALEKRRLAYHEAGHAVAQVKVGTRYHVTHATISKRLDSGGEAYVAYRAMEEIVTSSVEEIFAEIQVCLASRAAEEIFLQTRLNGVAGDLQHATRLALNYVTISGMGDSFFSVLAMSNPDRVFADPQVRREAEEVLRRAYKEVRSLLEQHRAAVVAVAEALIIREDLDGDEVMELIQQADASDLAQMAESALANVDEHVANGNGHPANVSNGHAPKQVIEGQLIDLPPL